MSKVVLITGATSGIGKETAELLASQGWKVVLSGRRQEDGKKIVEVIKAKGGDAVFIVSDVSTEAAVKDLVDKTVEIYGRLDGAVNNAGISTDAALFADLKTEEFERMIQVNVLGLFWCMKYQLKHMVPAKSGAIVNLASIAGQNGIHYSGTYSATKHAVVGMTKSAALDYAVSGVTINAIAPGAIKTDILKQAIESGAYDEKSISDMFPMKRMGEPMDIARGISFLLNSPFATGTILSVDGGFEAA